VRAHFQARQQAGQVVTGRGGCGQDGVRFQVPGLRQRPQRRRPGAGPAEGQHRALEFAHRLGKGVHVLVRHLAGDDWDMSVGQPVLARRLFQGRGLGLVVGFAVRPVVDDRFEAVRGRDADLADAELRRHRQERGDRFEFHGFLPP